MRQRKDGIQTRQRILRAARDVFAEKGYRAATHAEICERAGTNTAAINYHFGDKETLYAEAFAAAFEDGVAKFPPDAGIAPDASPEERLRGRLTSLMRRILDPGTREFDIMHHELADPTGLLKAVHQRCIQPMRKAMFLLVAELLGPGATDGQVMLGMMTVVSPVFHTMLHIRHVGTCPAGKCPRPRLSESDLGAFIEHTTRFVLAGLRRMRDGIETEDWPDMELPHALMPNPK